MTTPTPAPKQQSEDAKVESDIRTLPDGGSATSFNEITSADSVQVTIRTFLLELAYFPVLI